MYVKLVRKGVNSFDALVVVRREYGIAPQYVPKASVQEVVDIVTEAVTRREVVRERVSPISRSVSPA